MEKSLFAQVAEIRGKKSAGLSTFSFQFTPEGEQLKQMKGSLFLLVSLKDTDQDKALGKARELFASFKDKFYAEVGSNLRALEESLDYANSIIKQNTLITDLVVANLWGSVLYVGKLGEAGIILVRKGGIKRLEITKVASGVLYDKDYVFMADPRFLKNIDLNMLALQTASEDFEESTKIISKQLEETEGEAFCLRLSVQEPIEVAQPVLIADLDEVTPDEQSQYEIEGTRAFKKPMPIKLPKFKINTKAFNEKKDLVWRRLGQAGAFLNKYLKKLATFILTPWLPRTPGALEDAATKRKQKIFQITFLLAAVLLISLVISLFNHSRSLNKEKFTKAINLIENKLEDAQNLRVINPPKARSLVSEAEKELEKLSAKDPQAQTLRDKLDSLLIQINKIFTVKLTEFKDLSALKGKIDTSNVKIAASSLFVLDKGTGSVYKVGLSDKKDSIFISEKKGLQNIAVTDDFVYAQTSKAIWKVNTFSQKEDQVSASSSSWKNLIGADLYRENLYLLDKEAKQIWKYVPAAKGLGGPQKYFEESLEESPVSFAVDGAVWVASERELSKYYAGKKDAFTIKNSPKTFSEIVGIYTKDAQKNIYVLDKGAGGVMAIEKSSGEYQGFFKSAEIKKAVSLAVDEPNKKAYLLIEDAIFSFNLK